MAAVTYELNKLGWRAFQDLCAVVLQEVLGQTFVTFADSNDAGQDGGFHGTWTTPADVVVSDLTDFATTGLSVVAQCKFSANPSATLAPSDLREELDKIAALRSRGQCDGYLVLTNLRVSGATHAWFAEELSRLGITTARVLPGDWICTQIEKNWNLRRYVPRVYGLGDLGTILDDRRLRQARALMAGLSRELETFVPTDAYRKASDALTDHGFVLLLGEAACGKSTIAATLCMTALDNWRSAVKRVDSPEALITHWDPNDPNQLFWVDDAFGSIRHEPRLTDEWARRMDQVMTAISMGARVLLTSRDYIYRDAQTRLKEYAFPRLREQQVVIDVANLSDGERRQMLYNHLKVGDQPKDVLEQWRPELPGIARLDRFLPEMARRLSLKAFMPADGLRSAPALRDFVEHPKELLVDVLAGLDPAQRAAMAVVYLAGGELPAPFTPTRRQTEAVQALGAEISATTTAFNAIDGTFLVLTQTPDGDIVWRFKHPTIREGFAAYVAGDVATLSVYLDGITDRELVSQLDCGGPRVRGTLVAVPHGLYESIARRVPVPRSGGFGDPAISFLTYRCSDAFLRMWAELNEKDLPSLLSFGMYMDAQWQPRLLSRLHVAGALPDQLRSQAVEQVVEYAMEFDPGWADEDIGLLFTDNERDSLHAQLETEIVPDLTNQIDMAGDGWDSGTDAPSRYRYAIDNVDALKKAFAGNRAVLDACSDATGYIESLISTAEYDDDIPPPRTSLAPDRGAAAPEALNARDSFDDVAAGH